MKKFNSAINVCLVTWLAMTVGGGVARTQTPGDSDTARITIDKTVRQMDAAIRTVKAEEHDVLTGTDNGGTLKVYATGSGTRLISLEVWLSHDLVREDYYLSDGHLIFVRTARKQIADRKTLERGGSYLARTSPAEIKRTDRYFTNLRYILQQLGTRKKEVDLQPLQ